MSEASSKTLWENVTLTTPVVLTVIATILAGLSSGEMSNSQYARSMASQMQSKADDQWGYYQSKRLRAAGDENTAQILLALAHPEQLSLRRMKNGLEELTTHLNDAAATVNQIGNLLGAPPDSQLNGAAAAKTATTQCAQALDELVKRAAILAGDLIAYAATPSVQDATVQIYAGAPPQVDEQPMDDPATTNVLKAIEHHATEDELVAMAGNLDEAQLKTDQAIATKNSAAYQAACDDVDQTIEQLANKVQGISNCATEADQNGRELFSKLSELPSAGMSGDLITSIGMLEHVANAHARPAAQADLEINRWSTDLAVAQLQFDINRYLGESQRNQILAQLCDVQVYKDDFMSERHRTRSKQFFYAMLTAQGAVTIATISLGVKKRHLLWSIAAAAGLFVISFGAYVYLFI